MGGSRFNKEFFLSSQNGPVLALVFWGSIGAIQVLRNADGGGGVSDFREKSVTKV